MAMPLRLRRSDVRKGYAFSGKMRFLSGYARSVTVRQTNGDKEKSLRLQISMTLRA